MKSRSACIASSVLGGCTPAFAKSRKTAGVALGAYKSNNAAAFREFLGAEVAKWAKVIRDANVKVEN